MNEDARQPTREAALEVRIGHLEAEIVAMAATLQSLTDTIEKDHDWMFEAPAGEERSRAEQLMEVTRQFREFRGNARWSIRVGTWVVGFLAAWESGLGDFIRRALGK